MVSVHPIICLLYRLDSRQLGFLPFLDVVSLLRTLPPCAPGLTALLGLAIRRFLGCFQELIVALAAERAVGILLDALGRKSCRRRIAQSCIERLDLGGILVSLVPAVRPGFVELLVCLDLGHSELRGTRIDCPGSTSGRRCTPFQTGG